MGKEKSRSIQKIIYDATERQFPISSELYMSPDEFIERLKAHEKRKYGIFFPLHKAIQKYKNNILYK